MKKIIGLAIISLSLVGCSSNLIKVGDYTTSKRVNYPELNLEVTKGLGDSLVAKGTQTVGPVINVMQPTQFNKEENESSTFTCAVTAAAGVYFKRGIYEKKEINASCYGPVNLSLTLADGSTNWNCPGNMLVGNICSEGANDYFIVTSMATFPLKQDFKKLRKSEKTIQYRDNFIQELIYNGRVGDDMKFVYREFSGDVIRPAFSQEVQYDISLSNVIGFKKLRLRVLDATNTEIKYELLSNF